MERIPELAPWQTNSPWKLTLREIAASFSEDTVGRSLSAGHRGSLRPLNYCRSP